MKNERAEIFELLRSSFRIMISVTTFTLTANITLLGFAVNNKSAGLFFIGGLFPLALVVAYLNVSKLVSTIFFCGIGMEKTNPNDGSHFFSALLSSNNDNLRKKIEEALMLEDIEEQFDMMRPISNKFFPPYFIYYVPIWFCLQIIIAFGLRYSLDWPLFSS